MEKCSPFREKWVCFVDVDYVRIWDSSKQKEGTRSSRNQNSYSCFQSSKQIGPFGQLLVIFELPDFKTACWLVESLSMIAYLNQHRKVMETYDLLDPPKLLFLMEAD